MNDDIRATALVLRSVEYGDSDRIVTFFTREHGKLGAFARSARKSQKRFGGALEPFNRLRIRFQERRGDRAGLASLLAAEIEIGRPALLSDYDLIARASYLTELVSEATRDRESHPEMFDLLDAGLEALASPVYAGAGPDQRNGWLSVFELKLLALAGYRPILHACVTCGSAAAGGVRFFPERGSIQCEACGGDRGGIPVGAGTLRLLEAGLATVVVDLERLTFSAEQAREARQVLGAFLRYQFGKELKSAKFI